MVLLLIPPAVVLVSARDEPKAEATQVPLLPHVLLPGLPEPEASTLLWQARLPRGQQARQPAAMVS
jgi:hypothetical protein